MNPEGRGETKVISFRVYANKFYSYNLFNPSIAKNIEDNNPVFIDNFPDKGCELYCYFGKVPKHIIKLKYSIDGLGLYRKRNLFNPVMDSTRTEVSLGDCIAEVESTSNYFEGYCWFITIVIEKMIDPQVSGITDENGGTCPNKAHHYLRRMYKEFGYSEIFDMISFCLLTEIKPSFLDELLISEVAMVFDNNIVAFPRNMATQAEGYQFCDSESINKNKIISWIEKVNLPNNKKWLEPVARLRMSMLTEKDPWKRYYLGFVCLEVLTHRCFEKILAGNSFDVVMSKGHLSCDKTRIPLPNFISVDGKTSKIPLSMKFSLVAGVFNPEHFSEDISAFNECKKIRNKMSHGEIHSKEELPCDVLKNLLDFYLHEIFRLI